MVFTQKQLEHSAMDCLLQGEHEVISHFRKQYESATVTRREFTGWGFLTDFEVPEELKLREIHGNLQSASVMFNCKSAEFPGHTDSMFFVLFFDNGVISALEGFVFMDDWFEQDITKIDPQTFEQNNFSIHISETAHVPVNWRKSPLRPVRQFLEKVEQNPTKYLQTIDLPSLEKATKEYHDSLMVPSTKSNGFVEENFFWSDFNNYVRGVFNAEASDTCYEIISREHSNGQDAFNEFFRLLWSFEKENTEI